MSGSSLKADKNSRSFRKLTECELPLGFDTYLKPDKTLLLVYRTASTSI